MIEEALAAHVADEVVTLECLIVRECDQGFFIADIRIDIAVRVG